MAEYFPSIIGTIAYLMIVIVLGLLGFFGSGLVIKHFEIGAKALATFISTKIKTPYIIPIAELIFSLSTALLIVLYYREEWLLGQSFALPLSLLCITFEGMLIRHLRFRYINSPSIFKWIKLKEKKHPYLRTRIITLFKQVPSILIILLLFQVIVTILFTFSWPRQLYYIVFLALPLLLTFWVYLSFAPIDVQSNDTINARRFWVYLLLVYIAICVYYNKFETYILKQLYSEDIVWNLFLVTTSVLFISFDRILKLWSDDLRVYRNRKKQRQ